MHHRGHTHNVLKMTQVLRNANNNNLNIMFTYEASSTLPFLDIIIKIINSKPFAQQYTVSQQTNTINHLAIIQSM